MSILTTIPLSGKLIIAIIVLIFILALMMLFMLRLKYQRLCNNIGVLYYDSRQDASSKISTIDTAIKRYKTAYINSGVDINTPAIVESSMSSSMRSASLVERFIKNVVSLLVTLGLLGTFIGLTMAVSDLASMFNSGNATEVLAQLEIVGSGLVSSLGGMGVAFTTSLVGIACSIIFTLMNIIISPTEKRTEFMVSLEDYLDNVIAPKLSTNKTDSNAAIVTMMQEALEAHSKDVTVALYDTTRNLQDTAIWLNDVMKSFGKTSANFSENVRDFSEFNHHLRNNIERMDVNFIRLVEAMKDANKDYQG